MKALDLFAGTGWGVACRRLGIDEYGVEIMPEAVAVRALNDMTTLFGNVWDGLLSPRRVATTRALGADLLIASPPCQTFSMAGGGAGRRALDEVLAAIDDRLYENPQALVDFGDRHDPKTALVLAPLAYAYRDRPTYIVLEQVPPVLPVWQAYADVLRGWGYSVWTDNVQAEQYGVPQTRKRAILIGRRDGVEATQPTPTHSRYYSRDPQRLDEGVEPWVSMATALGWGMTERPMVTAGNAIGRAEGVGGSGAKAAIEREQSRGAWIGNQKPPRQDEYHARDAEAPAPTVTGGSRSAKIQRSNFSAGGKGETAAERGRTLRAEDQPSVAMTGKPGHWIPAEGERPSPTVTGGGAATGGAEPFGRHGRAIVEGMAAAPATATRISVAEASILQSYPADFLWDAEVEDAKGRVKPITKTNTFLQIGNAVPPLLAEAILRSLLEQ